MTRYRYGLLMISLLLQANLLFATEIYRDQDKAGNISFSDIPSENATKIRVQSQPYRYKHHVAKVYDGDTIILKNGQHVRLLGINTPEIDSHFHQGEQGGEQAKKWLQQKIESRDVYLEFDQQQRDKYDRTLAHVFLENGEHINQSLLESGLAILSIIPPNLRYSDALQQAQLKAEHNNLGNWALPAYQTKTVEPNHSVSIETGWHRFKVKPQQIKQTRKYVRLVLTKNLDIRIAKTDSVLFPDLSNYLNQLIEVRGWVSRQNDHYSILIRHPSALLSKKSE
ncbi:MAG: thermonuclease family protein [Gammaproteobacteria bacterium]|nr:thermonuclease family protein [Gammaproteobacteria bacterium]